MEVLLLRGAAAFYLAATIAALVGVAMRHDFPTRLFHWLVGAGLTLHIVSLVTRATLVGHLAGGELRRGAVAPGRAAGRRVPAGAAARRR